MSLLKRSVRVDSLDLRGVPDDELMVEYQRRQEIERRFVWAVSLMRDYAIWESENGRVRKITEWHARQIAEKFCEVLGITREDFANRVIDASNDSP